MKNNNLFITLCCILVQSILHLNAQDIYRLNQLIEQRPPTLTTSCIVYDLTDDTLLYNYSPHLRLRPASTLKLLTASTALTQLTEDTLFTTLMCAEHPAPTEKTLKGNLYFRGSMDPLFSFSDLQAFITNLKSSGVKNIEGDIVLDNTMKDTLHWGKGWCWDDDNPTLTPLLCDGKNNFSEQLKTLLLNTGITFNGILRDGTLPDSFYIFSERTHTLSEIMHPMLKNSNNLCAEAIFYLLSHKPYGHTKAEASILREYDWLSSFKAPENEYHVVDGSGLSLYNYMSTYVLNLILSNTYQHPKAYHQLLKALPIAGIDGTLKHRMHHTPAKGRIYAKTGTLFGVSSLSGYAFTREGHTLCFSIINQGVKNRKLCHTLEDNICVSLVK